MADAIVRTPIKNIQEFEAFMAARRNEVTKALPRYMKMDPMKLMRIVITTLSGPTGAKLLQCDKLSLWTAVINCAQVGLYPDGFSGEAYLVPYWNSNLYGKEKGGYEAKFMAGYRGLIKLALQSNRVNDVRAKVVYAGDEFDYEEGLVPWLKHKPTKDTNRRGLPTYAYAVAALKDVPPDQHKFHVMTFDEIEAIRLRAPNGHDKDGKPIGVWKSDWAEMAKKTCVRAMAKYMQLSTELTQAAVLDEYNELGVTLEGSPDAVQIEEPRSVDEPSREAGQSAAAGNEKQDAKASNGKENEKVGQAHIKLIFARARNADKTEVHIHAFLKKKFNLDSIKDVTLSKMNEIIEWCDKIGSEKEYAQAEPGSAG